MTSAPVYVSITGLRLKGLRHAPRFWWHAIRSMIQARAALGNRKAEARTIEGVHHTLTVWIDEEAMRHFLRSGAHLKAMKAFRDIATGSTLGFTTELPPDWSVVHELWRTKGKVV
jgi:hypothetical protein